MESTGETYAVSDTAWTIARMRARESLRPDRLFNDDLAQAFLDATPRKSKNPFVRSPAVENVSSEPINYFAIRTRFFDDYLQKASSQGCHQVVIFGAGLDTRAYRLDWPSRVRLFELDLPPVLSFKEKVLAEKEAIPLCERIPVPIDLRGNWQDSLTEAGFDSSQPTAWLIEGLIYYLDPAIVFSLIEAVTSLSAPQSRLSCEFLNKITAVTALINKHSGAAENASLAASWTDEQGAEIYNWFDQNGWNTSVHNASQFASACQRPYTSEFDHDMKTDFFVAVRG